MAGSCSFSRALHWEHVFALCFDWFIALSVICGPLLLARKITLVLVLLHLPENCFNTLRGLFGPGQTPYFTRRSLTKLQFALTQIIQNACLSQTSNLIQLNLKCYTKQNTKAVLLVSGFLRQSKNGVFYLWWLVWSPKWVFRRYSLLAGHEEHLSRSKLKSVEFNCVKGWISHDAN